MTVRIPVLALFTAVALGISPLTEAQTMTTPQALSARQQTLVAISAFTANGQQEKLKAALNSGLDAGLSVNETKEVLVQLYAYAGFPRSLNALTTLMGLLKEREARGIRDATGREASPLPADKSSLELGTENQTKLSGKPVTGELYTFAPLADQFLKAHLFGDIFGRDVLDFQTRELATVAALASLGGVNSQLSSHYTLAMNTGVTKEQLQGIIAVIGEQVGQAEGKNAGEVLNQVLSSAK